MRRLQTGELIWLAGGLSMLLAWALAYLHLDPVLLGIYCAVVVIHLWGLAFRVSAGKPFWELAMCHNCEKITWRWKVKPIWIHIDSKGKDAHGWGCEDCMSLIEFKKAVKSDE